MSRASFIPYRKVLFALMSNSTRLLLGLTLVLFMASQAAAQYGGGGGGTGGGSGSGTYTAPTGGYSSAKGAAIGAGAAGAAGILFLALHYHGRVTGCVQPADDGLRLLDQKNSKSYALVPGDVYLKQGQLVELKGRKSKNKVGVDTFTAQKLIKDLGACDTSSTIASTSKATK